MAFIINYLPVGSQLGTEFYAECCLRHNISLLNCIPVFIAREPYWQRRFQDSGVPIVGDDIYGRNRVSKYGLDKKNFSKFLILKNFQRQALHATHLGFFHPILKKNMEFNAKLPDDMANLLDLLLKH